MICLERIAVGLDCGLVWVFWFGLIYCGWVFAMPSGTCWLCRDLVVLIRSVVCYYGWI